MNPASFVKLRNNAERLSACYKKVTDNIQELTLKREMPDFVVVDNIGGGSGANNIVQLLVYNKVVWHNICRTAVDSQKVERAMKNHEWQELISPVKTCHMYTGARSIRQASP